MGLASSRRGEAQSLVVDIAVVSSRGASDTLQFRLIAKPGAIELPEGVLRSRGRVAGDTIVLTTPVQFSADLSRGDVIVVSSTATWLQLDLADSHGTMQGRASKLRVRKHPDSHVIEIRGLP